MISENIFHPVPKMYVNDSRSIFYIFYKTIRHISFYLDAGQEFVSTN